MNRATDDGELSRTLETVHQQAQELSKRGRHREAFEVAMQRVDLIRRCFGIDSVEFHHGRIDVAAMLVADAGILSAREQFKECCDLLLQAEQLLRNRIPAAYPAAVEFMRAVVSLEAHKVTVMTRYAQHRFKSASSSARAVIADSERLHCVWELPAAWLNYSAVLSAEKHHKEALDASSKAYESVVNLILALTGGADEHPQPHTRYFRAALHLETAAHSRNVDATQGALDELDAIVAAHGPALKSHMRKQRDSPNIAHALALIPTPQRQRWGGVLALVYRSMACEQEHLQQHSAAQLTHQIAASTAQQCLGPSHYITHQCRVTLGDAQQTKAASLRGLPEGRRAKLSQRIPGASGTPIVPHVQMRNSLNRTPVVRPQSAPLSAASNSVDAEESTQSNRPRPLWNQWFSSKDTPPLHVQAEQLARPKASQSISTPTAPPLDAATRHVIHPCDGGHTASRSLAAPSPEAHDAPRVLTQDDLRFLEQTFRVKHTPVAAPKSRHGGLSDARYYEMLAEQRRVASRLAKELAL